MSGWPLRQPGEAGYSSSNCSLIFKNADSREGRSKKTDLHLGIGRTYEDAAMIFASLIVRLIRRAPHIGVHDGSDARKTTQ